MICKHRHDPAFPLVWRKLQTNNGYEIARSCGSNEPKEIMAVKIPNVSGLFPIMTWGKTTLIVGILLVITALTDATLRYSYQEAGTPYIRNQSDPAFISKCIYDNAKDLICHYELAPSSGPLNFNYALPSVGAYNCPHQGKSNCTWYADGTSDQPKRGLEYYLFFTSENKKVSNVVIMKPMNEVKPSKVRSVTVIASNTSLTVSWRAPELYNSIPMEYLYTISIRLRNIRAKLDEKNTTDSNVTFYGLTPNEEYEVEIQARGNSESGHWSDPFLVSYKTSPGLPTANPEIAVYYWLNGTHVRIIWKPLTTLESRGPRDLLQYDVKEMTGQFRIEGITDYMVDLPISENLSYGIELYATQLFGNYSGRNSSIPPTLLRITWPRREIIAELSPVIDNENRVKFYWTPAVNVTNYNLLWCEQGDTKQTCKDAFNWGHVLESENGKWLNISLSAKANYSFAISANYADNEQGPLTWSSCSFINGRAIKKPPKPFGSHLMKAKKLHVEWNLPTCGESGYILKYIVHYCIASDCSNTVRTAEVSSTVDEWQTAEVKEGHKYQVWLEAVSPDTKSLEGEKLTVTVKTNKLNPGFIALIVVVIIVVLGLIVFVLYHFKRKYNKMMEELAITIPEKEKLENEDNLTYDYLADTERANRPESRNSDNISNARREGFESRASENLRNEYHEKLHNGKSVT